MTWWARHRHEWVEQVRTYCDFLRRTEFLFKCTACGALHMETLNGRVIEKDVLEKMWERNA